MPSIKMLPPEIRPVSLRHWPSLRKSVKREWAWPWRTDGRDGALRYDSCAERFLARSAGIVLNIVLVVEPRRDSSSEDLYRGNPFISTCRHRLTYKGPYRASAGFHGVVFETQAGLFASISMRIPRAKVPKKIILNAVTMQRTNRLLTSSIKGPAPSPRDNYG